MNGSVGQSKSAAHRELSDIEPRMAKATVRHIRKTDIEADAFRVRVGQAIKRAASLLGWSLKELSAAIEHDPRQVARWIDGKERPHLDALFAVEELRQPLVVAIAEMAGEQVEIETVVRVRRTGGLR